MSKLAEFKALEAQLAEQMKQLDALKNDDGLKREIEFEQKLRALLGEYSFSLREVKLILDPHARPERAAPAPRQPRRERQVKVYLNPNNGERIETKGGNHKLLKEWKAEYGAEKVESWLQ
ncbi:histone-like nucleoid-structuring protein, MvaT/MvaU family [Pseudomonas putida]|uniref:histone-like nucleoid-structuring protein, MvaT/MvaU family n=1 Tax=Pseudomonas putida TaxID=303 RepID=UPI000D34DAF6|nr:histone-like nucleoid-structuring protein, MvaT/MvaU family [Pseudomonas putida]PTV51803.1 transcriptional regulator [Pseudomonas putida]